MQPIDLTTGLPCGSPVRVVKPFAWAVKYAGRVALFLERARAEQAARDLHGVLIALFEASDDAQWPVP